MSDLPTNVRPINPHAADLVMTDPPEHYHRFHATLDPVEHEHVYNLHLPERGASFLLIVLELYVKHVRTPHSDHPVDLFVQDLMEQLQAEFGS